MGSGAPLPCGGGGGGLCCVLQVWVFPSPETLTLSFQPQDIR